MKLLIVEDEKLYRWSLDTSLKRAGFQTLQAASVKEARHILTTEEPDIVLLDVHLPDGSGMDLLKWARGCFPDMMFMVVTARGQVEDAVTAMRSGAYHYVQKPEDMGTLVEQVQLLRQVVDLKRELLRFKSEEMAAPTIIAESPAMVDVLGRAHTAAERDIQTVLILGESGSGKDLLARFIHIHSKRSSHPFMVINCAALPETLLESELFGYEKGAFTDAKILKRGIFELAHEGTVFLDEIGEMNAAMQSKVLRVLEDSTFKRVGGTRDMRVNVQVIAATNQDLEQMVKDKRFREDLYYRVNVYPIQVPSLRERPEDILAIAKHFIHIYNKKFGKHVLGLSSEAAESLVKYPWPGNVRELRNVMERTMILQNEVYIKTLDFLLKKTEEKKDPFDGILRLQEVEHMLARRALALTKGNVVRAARLLGISRDQLRYKIKKHGL